MFIPGQAISIATFPGIVVHEIAHQLLCRFFRVAIFDVSYFQHSSKEAGYVSHEVPRACYQSVIISIAPFFINTIIGLLITLPTSITLLYIEDPQWYDFIFAWLGISILMHAFPSTGDAKCIRHALNTRKPSLFLKIISYPLVGLIYLASWGSYAWLDAVYAILITLGVMNLFLV